MFAAPLYVFNPLVLEVSAGAPDISNVQPDLPPENYIRLICEDKNSCSPERWTVLTYVGVSALLLLIGFVALVLGSTSDGPESPVFPFVDSLKLRWVMTDAKKKRWRILKRFSMRKILATITRS